jgi:Kef-type K+ transport system membrane component KefB
MAGAVFNQFAILITLSVIVGYIAIRLRQPLILSFIIVGIIAGPAILGWISAQSEIEVLASFGITLLLFIVGLKLDLDLIKTFGAVVMIAGLGQILLTAGIGSLLGIVLGLSFGHALFVAFALTFSSTIIIIKILSDNVEIDSLYGRISLGILIVQDLVVVVAIIVLSSLSIHYAGYSHLGREILILGMKGVGFLAVIGMLMRFVFPALLEQFAKSRELLILFAIAWAVMLTVGADALGFGKEVGGFLAGVSLASSKYREAIASRLETVRNLLLLFFFLNLGASLRFDALGAEIVPALAFSLFVLVGKPFIVIVLMGLLKFRKRTSFLTGLTMGQISEFSLILTALGMNLGYIDENIAGMITFIGLVSIALSTYMMTYSNILYQWINPWLNLFEREMYRHEDTYHISQHIKTDVIIYGFGRHGENLARHLEKSGYRILAIDFDPRKVHTSKHHHILIKYGDAEDVEFVKTIPLDDVKWVVSTIPHPEANQMLVSSLREVHYKGRIALSAYHEGELDLFRKMQVDLIFVPYEDAAISAAQRLVEKMRQESE